MHILVTQTQAEGIRILGFHDSILIIFPTQQIREGLFTGQSQLKKTVAMNHRHRQNPAWPTDINDIHIRRFRTKNTEDEAVPGFHAYRGRKKDPGAARRGWIVALSWNVPS
jgi:hypothetical protein